MAVLERIAERLLRSGFVDLGTVKDIEQRTAFFFC